jgi:hypothetical protein
VEAVGYVGCCPVLCGLHLEGKTMSEQQTQQADDPSGPGWRDVLPGEILHVDDMVQRDNGWGRTRAAGIPAGSQRYRRRIEPQQPSGSKQVNAELQQLREQVATLTQELKDKNDTYQLCLQNHYKAGQRSAIDKLQAWLRPVLEVVSDHPDHTSILAASVLEFLPQIASRLIEE